MSYTNGLDKPSDYFVTKLYTGNESNLNITGLDFAPNWVWIKDRTTDHSQCFYDSVRGVQKRLQANNNEEEGTDAQGVTAFNSDGFTIGNSSSVNQNNDSFVSWNWLGGGSASSNSNGTITSTVSANTTSGFSIVSYTGNGSAGATVGHGVGSALDMIIVKKRSSTAQWVVGHKAMDSTFDNFLFLDSTSAKGNADNVFNDTAPTSSVFSIGNAGDTNASSQTYVAYCFAEKKGYSKFGSYTGNGNADGPFVYLGFRPTFCMFRNTTGDKWSIFDAKRSPFNVVDDNIRANLNNTEVDQANKEVDFLSNGIKIRTSSGEWNGSGHQLIIMAFAESPFVTSTGIPTTAR